MQPHFKKNLTYPFNMPGTQKLYLYMVLCGETNRRIDAPVSSITRAVNHVRSQFAVGSFYQVVQSICNFSQEVNQNSKIISCTQNMLHDRHFPV